ncbi:MAG: LamG domain-containing protein, partial [Nitrosopumilus sp.]|uniref:LamG domain-containing protein n=1 Tax=Nitrosopumilus sp. TaxID=2024843 RepID=UPI0034A05A90
NSTTANDTTTNIIPVNGTIIPGTNSTGIPVNGTIIPGTNSTGIPVILPNATESWKFDTQVNGSHFIGDVYIKESDSSLILDGEGYLSNNGNSTSDVSNISITAWVNPDYSAGSAEFTVISKEKSFALTINNNIAPQKIAKFAVFDGIKWYAVETSTQIGNDWSHIAATFNGTALSIYTNGTISNVNESVETISMTIHGKLEPKTIETIKSTSDVIIGASLENQRTVDDVTKQFHGEIKEVNIFNVYLTAEQVAEIYLQTLPTIQSLYNKTTQTTEKKQTIIIDVFAPKIVTNSTNVNGTNTDLSNVNGTNIDLPNVNGTNIDSTNATKSEIIFNATQNYIPIKEESLNQELDRLTISTWINPDYTSGSAEFTVVSKESSFVLGINNVYSPEKIPTFAIFDGITWTKIVGKTQINDWAHLVAVINGTEISLYLNGNLEAHTIIPKSFVIFEGEMSPVLAEIAENDSDLIIGAYLNTLRSKISLSNHFSGTIDDVLIYKEALSSAQINEIHSTYLTPSENYKIPFESHLLSFTDSVTVFVNNELISDTIYVAPINPESEKPSIAQSLSFADYVTYKVNGSVNDVSVEVILFSDVVVATLVSDLIMEQDNSLIIDSISFSDVVVATIISNDLMIEQNDELTIVETLSFDDSILIKLNGQNTVNLSESLQLDSLLSLSDDTDTSNSITDIQLGHNTIEINRPVIWTHNVTFHNNTESFAMEIPADAEILMIKTLNDTSETIIFDSNNYSALNVNYTGLYDDDDISEKDLKKYFRLIDSIQIIETKINNTSEKIAYYANLDTAKAHKKLDKLTDTLDKLEVKLEKKLDNLPGNVSLASLKQVDKMLQKDKPLKVLLLNSTDPHIELTFTTPAAYTVEQNNSTNDKFDKKITVAHQSALHYSNVTTYTDIPENLVIGGTNFKLFWNIDKSLLTTNSTDLLTTNSTDKIRVDVTNDPRFAVEFVDTDGNGIVDRMQWIVPQLSEQEFDIEADLEIINVQSYPAVGGTWKVKFTTNGTANLTITAINGTTFGTVSPDDLLFLELNNGTHKLNPIVNGNSITYYNYSSTAEGFEESEVLTPFKHHLMFQFGNKTAYANNSAFVPNGPKTILLFGDPIVFGTPDTEDDLAISNAVIPGWDEIADRQDSIFTHDHTGGGCNSIDDSCTEIKVSDAGTYRVNYGLSIDGGITANRYQAVSFIQNDTDGVGGYTTGKGISCFDSSYRRSVDNKNTEVFSGECLVDLQANGKVRVGLSKISSLAGSGAFTFADNENWFQMEKVVNPIISLRKSGTSVTVTSTSAEMIFNNTDIVKQDTSAFTFTESNVNWGDTTQQGTATPANWLRCMGGTSPNINGMVLESASVSSTASGANARIAVYQGGSLSDPQAATLVWDGGIISAGTGFVTKSGASAPLAANTPTWICLKDNDNNFNVHYNTSHDSSSNFQSGLGRWAASGLSTDETVAYPSSLAGGGTSFSNFWYSFYLTYRTPGHLTVDQDGLYKVSYSALYNDPTFDSSRASIIGKIQTNSTGSFADNVYGGSVTYNRDEDGINYSALSSSTILELNKDDEIRFMSTDEGTRTSFATDYHLDVEYLGTTSNANALRVYNSVGGLNLDDANDVLITWDKSDEIGSHFTFTGDSSPTSEITINVDSLYHIAYGIDATHTGASGDRFAQKTRLQINSGSGWNDAKACFGDGFSRGRANANDHFTSTAATSCMLDLKIGDKLRVVSKRVGDELLSTNINTTANEIYLTIQSLSISNPPLQDSLSFVDLVTAFVVKNKQEQLSLSDTVTAKKDATVTLTESLSLDDPLIVVDKDGQVLITLDESLLLSDTPITNLILPIKIQESLSFADVLDVTIDGTISLSESLTLNDDVLGEPFVPANPDFKTQYGTFTFSGTSGTLTEGTNFDACSSAESCFIMQVGTRHTGMGVTSGGGAQNTDDWTIHISDDAGLTDSGQDITFTRFGSVGTQRTAWQILEYIGPTGGPNEMKVLDTGVVSFTGSQANQQGSVISGGAADDNDVAVIITGVSNPETSSIDVETGLVTTEWRGGSNNVPVFNRTATGSDAIVVSYAVVEFTGSAWNLQRITHQGTDAPFPTQTETIANVGDLSRAFILQAQQRNADSNTSDGLCEVGERVHLSDTTTLSFDHEFGSTACLYSDEMEEVVWVLSNSIASGGKKMIVEHQQPTDQLNTSGTEEEAWSVGFNTLTYGLDEASIFGFTSNSDGVGTAYPRGSIVATINTDSSANFWQSDSGQAQGYSFSIVQWPRSKSIPIAFTETLTLSTNFSVEHKYSEQLSLSDTVTAKKDATITLTESLSLDDAPVFVDKDGQVLVTLDESLLLSDTPITNLILPIKIQESLSFADVLDVTIDGTISLSESLTLNDDVENIVFIPSNPDFKTQYGTFTIANTASSNTITSSGGSPNFDACSSAESCFIMQTSTRQTGMGTTSGGGTQDVRDVTTYISNDGGLTTPGTVTFSRSGTTNDNRIAWQILEYIGPTGGPNEMKVLDTGVVSFTGSQANQQGSVISGGAADDNDVAVIITGVSNPETSSIDVETGLVTTEWRGGSNNVPVFNRTATGSDAIVVSYAVVEFTGSAWNLQRITHQGTDAPFPTQTETIANVGDLSRAFILQAQQRNADGAENVCETGERVHLSDITTLAFDHEFGAGACTFDSQMEEVVWILSNSIASIGKKMIVEHQLPADQLSTGGAEEDQWDRSFSTLTYGLDEASIFGFTSNSDGTGNTHPRGTIVGQIQSSSSARFWQSDANEDQGYSFSIVQWPRSRILTASFAENLSFNDDNTFALRITLTESLLLDDGTIESPKINTISLNESLSLEDNINRNIPVSLTESLSLSDGTVDTDAAISVSLTESLSLEDNINRTASVSLSED